MTVRAELWTIALLLAACSPEGSKAPGASAQSGDQEERYYGAERFTIVTSVTAERMTGTKTEHVRDWGRSRVTILKASENWNGKTTEVDFRQIWEGPKVTVIDNSTGLTTQEIDPAYSEFVAAVRGKSADAFAAEQMRYPLNAHKTGESDIIAGQKCDYWAQERVDVKVCMTPWGADLRTSGAKDGANIDSQATEVRIGDGGPDEAFAYDPSKVQTEPAAPRL